ncbi:MAG: hypothetical protein M3Y13_11255 [Armatimonadota bacterium]|nr:hypothetical protein [Armatimonadota bacterium]
MVDFDDLPDYLTWANTRAVQMLEQAPMEEGVRIFAHLLAVEVIWAERILGLPAMCPQRPDWDMAECVSRIAPNAACYRDLIGRFQQTDIARYRNSKGEEFESLVADILRQVFTHGAYHRGQISQAVKNLGGEIIDTDYILFKRQ